MKDRSVLLYLNDIVESIEAIESHIAKVNKREFMKNILVQDAVVRRIEVIGEAVNRMPKRFKNKYPEIEWHKPVGMRNILIHGYMDILFDVVWNTAKKVLPKFKEEIKDLMKLL